MLYRPVSVYRRTALDKVLDDYLGVGDKHCTLGAGEDRDLTGLLLLGYGFIHLALTLTVRCYALCTVCTTRWETRG